MKNFIASALLILSLNSCLARFERAGYMFDSYDVSSISEDITSKQTILKNMGNPTIKSDLDGEETWIYLTEEVRHFLFLKPKVISREILAMNFDNDNVVRNLVRLDLKDENRNFDFNRKRTAVDSHKTSSIKDLFENIGQVRPM